MNVLAISGSLREECVNAACCRAAARLAPPPLRVSVFPAMVSNPGTVNKPVALINMSLRAQHADKALREVLRTMSMHVIPQASVSIVLPGECVTEDAMLAAPPVRHAIEASLAALASHMAGDGGCSGHFRPG